MATKDEIIGGIELLVREAKRLATDLPPDQLEHAVDLDGWKGLEAFAHIAGVGGMVAPMAGGLGNAPAGADAFAAIDIDQMNAGIVAARKGKTAQELAQEIETGYRGAIDFVRNAPDDLLARRVTALGYKDVPLGDILIRMVVLHGLAHIYSVYASVFNANAPAKSA